MLVSMSRKALPLLALVGCTSSSHPADDTPPEVAWPLLDCDPIVPDHCGSPFPNNVFTADDPSTPTGRRVALSDAAMPVNYYDVRVDPTPWNVADGFSAGIGPFAFLPGATITGLPRHDSIQRSLEPGCPTVLLDVDAGELVPHWAELDMTADDASRRPFVIRPVVRIPDGHRVIVAIRDVVDDSGEPIPASDAFAALRDGTPHDDPSIEERRGLYADIFHRLAEVDVERESLQLAWDYTVASRANNTSWLVHMRDEALAIVGTQGPEYSITSVEMAPEPGLVMWIEGTMKVPLYLDQPGPGAHLLFGDDGMPEINAAMPWADYPFKVLIPEQARTGPRPLAGFGHGLFSEMEEIVWSEIPFTTSYGYIVFATNWIGMAGDDDRIHVGAFIDNGTFEDFSTVTDRLHQGVLNHLLAMRLMSGRFVDEPMIQLDGHSAIDPTHRYYFGSSQGGIVGGTYMALTTDVERGLLDTAGQPYNLLLQRSADFDEFFTIIKAKYSDPRDIGYLLALAQMLWDRTEPNGYTHLIERDLLPGTPAHRVIVRPALGDHQVSNLGAHVMARAIGAKHFDTGLRDVWGLEQVGSPYDGGSVLVEYDFGIPTDPLDNLPQRECGDPHDVLRTIPEAMQQLDHFWQTGEIVDYCDGPCSHPELSGCE